MTKFKTKIAEKIWNDKYRKAGDDSVVDTWLRIAKALAKAEKDVVTFDEFGLVESSSQMVWEEEFFRVLEDFKFIPAGRIISGAGTGLNVTLFNCFVMGTVPDSMSGIFDMLKEAALTMQQGGGIGYDFSTIRPKGSLVKGVNADASGPLSFMDVWDAMCRTVMSAGARRGAMMATMRCDHPDIEQFITAKQDPARLRNFNLSVLITDPFMEAVWRDDDWNLVFEGQVYSTVKARDLWETIMRSTYNAAEPGVIFIDRINELNNLAYCETIAATNPCGEQPLPPYGACLLGSMNLTKYVLNPFMGNYFSNFDKNSSFIDKRALEKDIATAVRMMDNVVDVSNFPLPEQKAEAKKKRRIGLGVTGLADMLAMIGVAYGSPAALDITEEIMATVANAAYKASAELAKEKGAFPLYDREEFLKSPNVEELDNDVVELIREHGIRNALLTSIAPTGTISLFADNVSSGIEPIFAHEYTRKVLEKDGTHTEELVQDYAVALYREMFPDEEELPSYFVSVNDLTPEDHVKMQAAAQYWVDSSISKTVNCPEDITFEEFKGVYELAYKLGCKGCTTYRPNEITGSILSVSDDSTGADDMDQIQEGGACTIEIDPDSGQLIRTCE